MKTFLIFLLSALLATGAFMSRPSLDDFRNYAAKANPKSPAEGYTYQDYYLWGNVQKDGKTLYVGVFNHWFSHDLFSGGK